MTQTTKHTPGPWVNDDGLVYGQETRERFQPSPSIDIFDAKEWPAELEREAHANARLIAAAPELLVALNDTLAYIVSYAESADADDPCHEILWRWQALVAKAEGR